MSETNYIRDAITDAKAHTRFMTAPIGTENRNSIDQDIHTLADLKKQVIDTAGVSAAAVINALDADADGAIAQYVQADPSLRFAAGGIQKHIVTGIVSGSGQTLAVVDKASAIWIDPDGVEHVGTTFVSTQPGPHRLWMPVEDIGAGVAVRVHSGGVLTHLRFPPLTSLTEVWCYNNSISTLDVADLTSLTRLFCSNNNISNLDIGALTSLTRLWCHLNNISTLDVAALTLLKECFCYGNGMSQSAVDDILAGLVTAGVTDCNVQIHGSNAPPSSAGLGHVSTLQGRGCAITHS